MNIRAFGIAVSLALALGATMRKPSMKQAVWRACVTIVHSQKRPKAIGCRFQTYSGDAVAIHLEANTVSEAISPFFQERRHPWQRMAPIIVRLEEWGEQTAPLA
jgi:hypothetical protein